MGSSHCPAKPAKRIGVPTRMNARGPLRRELLARDDAGACVAPFGPDVFPMERRSRYETGVYAGLCPFSLVDMVSTADRLRKVEKGLKTEGFRDSGGSDAPLWTAAKSGLSRGRSAAAQENAEKSTGMVGVDDRRGGLANGRRWDPQGFRGPCRPGTGGSVTFATADASSFTRRRVHAGQSAWRGVAAGRPRASMGFTELIDLEGIFSQPSTSGCGRGRSFRVAPRVRDGQHRDALPERPLGAMSFDSEVDPCRPVSLPAQPLQSCSAVDRFDSSSPHGNAVRGNQEKTR